MNTPLTLVEPLDPVLTQRAHEDALIDEALQLLDQRYFQRGEVLITPADAASYLKLRLAPYHHEVFALLYLDSQHRVLDFEVLFFGSIDGASVYPVKWWSRHWHTTPPQLSSATTTLPAPPSPAAPTAC
jgi:DNA repair protein RadC